MKEFLLVYRADYSFMPDRTPEEMQAMMKRWMDWIGGIAAQNKLVSRGNRLESSGKVIRSDSTVTNGPYAEIKESIGGYSVVKAESYDAAIELAKGCPVLSIGGNVEVREISQM
ncbi:YciI family protein [Longitalea arenae]|uniref:YciI family protein n=1 Tax=Longitalea arenae TaxID=2812558 RepID=UPI0019675508|nr:YciI family protein [Longitalea arenae]